MTTLTVEQVFSYDYGLSGPFTIDLDNGNFIEVEHVLRYLPGKRIACQAQWNGKKIFAKLFNQKAASEGHVREQQGFSLLKEKNINTANFLETYIDGHCQIVFYEMLAGSPFSINKNDHDAGLDAGQIKQAFEFIANLHNADLIHVDLHINNLFSANKKLYLLDVGAVEKTNREDVKAENFALFIAQFPLCHHDALIAERHYYEKIKNTVLSKQHLANAARACWEKRKKQYLKKIFRNCTEICRIKNSNKNILVKRNLLTPSFMKALDNPDETMAGGVFLKDGNSQTVTKIVIDGMSLVVKRYNQKTLWNSAKRKLGINRARNCWRYAHLLAIVGIETPLPVAIIEETKGAVYYICMHADGEKLSRYFKEKQSIDEFARPLKSFFDAMHLARLAHGDLKASNILVANGELCLIDLDAMTEKTLNYFYKRKKDRDRFLANFEGTDTFIKIKNYLEGNNCVQGDAG